MQKKIKFIKISFSEYLLLLVITIALLSWVFLSFHKNALTESADTSTAYLQQQLSKDEALLHNYIGLSVNISQNSDVLLMQESESTLETFLEAEALLKQHLLVFSWKKIF